jgi:hypothetical protein
MSGDELHPWNCKTVAVTTSAADEEDVDIEKHFRNSPATLERQDYGRPYHYLSPLYTVAWVREKCSSRT